MNNSTDEIKQLHGNRSFGKQQFNFPTKNMILARDRERENVRIGIFAGIILRESETCESNEWNAKKQNRTILSD